MKKVLSVLNLITLCFAIAVNYWINTKHSALPSIGEISARYDTLLTPAGYAFAIWGLIYLSLLAFVGYQLYAAFKKNFNADFIPKTGWWFLIANLSNAAWAVAFTTNQIGLSLAIMAVLFLSLLKIVINTNMERWDAPEPVIFFIWWPVSLYFGWINMALIANISAYLTYLGWNGAPIEQQTWAIIILLVALAIFITMIWKRNMREYASVGAWGIIGVTVKNWESHPLLAWIALIIAVIILVNTMVHGYRNRATAPFARGFRSGL